MNISQITMFAGVLSGEIHTVMCSLFMDKWRAEQPGFVEVGGRSVGRSRRITT